MSLRIPEQWTLITTGGHRIYFDTEEYQAILEVGPPERLVFYSFAHTFSVLYISKHLCFTKRKSPFLNVNNILTLQ